MNINHIIDIVTSNSQRTLIKLIGYESNESNIMNLWIQINLLFRSKYIIIHTLF